jgi:hypothetical protein
MKRGKEEKEEKKEIVEVRFNSSNKTVCKVFFFGHFSLIVSASFSSFAFVNLRK